MGSSQTQGQPIGFKHHQSTIRISYSEEAVYTAISALVCVMADDMLYLRIGRSKDRCLFSVFPALSGVPNLVTGLIEKPFSGLGGEPGTPSRCA